jgi:hypothetical protein
MENYSIETPAPHKHVLLLRTDCYLLTGQPPPV